LVEQARVSGRKVDEAAMVLDASGTLRVREQLQQHLRPGEELLWYGRPDPAVLFGPGDLSMIPFTVLWLAFAIFWESGVIRSGAGPWPEIWGIPFIAVGLYALAGRFIYKRISKKRTAYGITGERAIIVAGNVVSDMPLGGVPTTVRRSRSGSHASVTFGDLGARRDRDQNWLGRRRRSPAFYANVYGNTGMEPLTRRSYLPFAFYDVAQPAAMLSALSQAQAPANW
jgi:hypothetical protein